MKLLTLPLPAASMNFTGMICTFQSTPAIPAPLLPVAPRIPETCVPCPLSSNGLSVLLTKFQPNRSSGCVVSPSLVLPLIQPPTLYQRSRSPASMRPSPLLSQTRPLFNALLRSRKVITPGVAVLIADLDTSLLYPLVELVLVYHELGISA